MKDTMIVIYVDGGQTVTNKSDLIQSWGIVSHMNDTTVEVCGSYKLKNKDNLRGNHELIAFIESYLFAKSHGPYRRVRVDCRVRAHFYGDEHGTFELRTAMQKENRPRTARDAARRRQQRDILRKGT